MDEAGLAALTAVPSAGTYAQNPNGGGEFTIGGGSVAQLTDNVFYYNPGGSTNWGGVSYSFNFDQYVAVLYSDATDIGYVSAWFMDAASGYPAGSVPGIFPGVEVAVSSKYFFANDATAVYNVCGRSPDVTISSKAPFIFNCKWAWASTPAGVSPTPAGTKWIIFKRHASTAAFYGAFVMTEIRSYAVNY